MLTTIPFSGFYDSMHSAELDRELESIISDSSGCHSISDRLSEEIWDCVNWSEAFESYAKDYAEYFAHWFETEFKVTLTFEWFIGPDGYIWHGVQRGDNNTICRVRRTKQITSSKQSGLRGIYENAVWRKNGGELE